MNDDTVTGPVDEYAEMSALVDRSGGRVTPAQVLEQASDPTSTFHRHFEWDDGEAAHRFRLQQAAGLIRKFKVVRDVGGRTIRADAFVRVPDSNEGYMPLQQALTTELLVQRRRLELIARMETLAEQLRDWDEFAGIAAAISEALAA